MWQYGNLEREVSLELGSFQQHAKYLLVWVVCKLSFEKLPVEVGVDVGAEVQRFDRGTGGSIIVDGGSQVPYDVPRLWPD